MQRRQALIVIAIVPVKVRHGAPANSDLGDERAVMTEFAHFHEVPQICPAPPSTLISTPVMYEASSDARNATVAATSSGCPKRFIGTFSRICFANSSTASCDRPVRPKIGVTIGPGATVLTRMPRPTSSAAAVRSTEPNAALVAE